jgi:tRNA threonylcarbamoyladenosine biosynthesis protein TsaB
MLKQTVEIAFLSPELRGSLRGCLAVLLAEFSFPDHLRHDPLVLRQQFSVHHAKELFPELIKLLESAGKTPEDIGRVVVTLGPGRYTGVRIALTFAKVFAAMREIPVYTLKSLQLCAGMEENARVLYDARGHRAYQAVYSKGEEILAPEARDITEIGMAVSENERILGDGHLIEREDCWPDLAKNFLLLQEKWEKAENVHLLTPVYLKPAEAYLVKK